MDFSEFCDYVKGNVVSYLPREYSGAEVKIKSVLKNNDTTKTALSIQNAGEHINAVIYLDDYFEQYENGGKIDEILEEIALIQQKNSVCCTKMKPQNFVNFGSVQDKITVRLISKSRNRQYLEDHPHRDIEDLAVVYQIEVRDAGERNAYVVITNELLKILGITENELNKRAILNTPRFEPVKLQSIEQAIGLPNSNNEENDHEQKGMYVLSNTAGMYGAAAILYPGISKHIRKEIGECYILPSSIHELILVPKGEGVNSEELRNIVKNVNETSVESEEFLSDEVYEFNPNGRISIAS